MGDNSLSPMRVYDIHHFGKEVLLIEDYAPFVDVIGFTWLILSDQERFVNSLVRLGPNLIWLIAY